MQKIAQSFVKAQKVKDKNQETVLLHQLSTVMGLRPKKTNQNAALPMPQRFISKLIFGATDCWLWNGSRNRGDYGTFPYQGESKAHRVSYRLFKGSIPTGMNVLHRCDVPSCVNPDHLFLGTQKDNVLDMVQKKRHRCVPKHGEQNPMAKLTVDLVNKIRSMAQDGIKQNLLAKEFAVSPMTISRIVNRESWNV